MPILIRIGVAITLLTVLFVSLRSSQAAEPSAAARTLLAQQQATLASTAKGTTKSTGDAVVLQTQCRVGSTAEVEMSMEISGDLKIVKAGKTTTVPTGVVAEQKYDERMVTLGADKLARRSIRHYDTATAILKVGKDETKLNVRDDRRIVSAETGDGAVRIYSSRGPLLRDELDLLGVPCSSLVVEHLLPTEAVKPGDTWKPSDAALAALLGIDAVNQNNVECKFAEQTPEVAKLIITGSLSGAVEGVSTEIELKGRFQFDHNVQRVVWLALNLREKRSIGHVGPGLDVVAKVKMNITPIAQSNGLAEISPDDLKVDYASAPLLAYESDKGGFRLMHDRRWHLTNEVNSMAVMRLVDRGELVAQCNITPLPKVDRPTTLGDLQADVKKSLGKPFGEFVSAVETVTDSDITVQRVVAIGVVSELPIQWNYYLVADNATGRRISFAFTVEGNLVERLAEADRAVVDSIEFLPEPTSAKTAPTATKPTKKTVR